MSVRVAAKVVVVIFVIFATKLLFNWMDAKWIEDCEARGGYYQREGLGEGCYND